MGHLEYLLFDALLAVIGSAVLDYFWKGGHGGWYYVVAFLVVLVFQFAWVVGQVKMLNKMLKGK